MANVQAFQAMKEAKEAMRQHPRQSEYVDLELNAIRNYKERHKIYVEYLR